MMDAKDIHLKSRKRTTARAAFISGVLWCCATMALTGCASGPLELNEPSHSVVSKDLAPLALSEQTAAYEFLSIDNSAVGYNLRYDQGGDGVPPGYRMTVVIRNDTTYHEAVLPNIQLSSAEGFVVSPLTPEELSATSPRLQAWAHRYWLKEEYILKPAETVSGALYFPSKPMALPLSIEIEINGDLYTFKSRRDQ